MHAPTEIVSPNTPTRQAHNSAYYITVSCVLLLAVVTSSCIRCNIHYRISPPTSSAIIWDFTKGTIVEIGPGSSVGIATGYGLDGPSIESQWGEIFRTCPHRPWGPPILLYYGYQVFPGGKERPVRDSNPSPPSSALVKKG